MSGMNKTVIIGALVLGLVGGAAGNYLMNTFNSKPTITITNAREGTPGKEIVLSDARNTFVVQVARKVGPAVVGISSTSYALNTMTGQILEGDDVGSGVILDKAGYIVTNYHVVAKAADKKVRVSLATGAVLDGKVIGVDPMTDLAVVKIDPKEELTAVTVGNSDELQVGEPAIAIGNPLGLEFQGTVTSGVISALHRTVDLETQRFGLIQTDAAINPGNSGGALVNADGELVGINSSKISHVGIEGIGFAIPSNEMQAIVKALVENGRVRRPYIGVSAMDKDMAKQYDLDFREDGLLVVRVDPYGDAYDAGVRAGDVISAVDGKSLKSMAEFKQAIDHYKPKDTVSITILRDGEARTVKVRLGELQG